MTKPTPHGQAPEALIDLIDTYAETRYRCCGGIYHPKTEAARNAVIEALSGVQALSAAQAEEKVASSAVLKAIREANMQLVRTGDDAFMLVPYKVATAEQQAAPKAAPGEQNTVPAEWLEQAYHEGWAACRDAETIGEEAEDWAFGNSTANSRMIDAQQAAPQQEVQEPVAWYEYNADLDAWFLAYSRNPKAKTRPLVFGDTAPQPAPAPLSADVVKDAARYRWLRATTNYVTSNGERIDVRNMPETWDVAIDAALAAQGGKV